MNPASPIRSVHIIGSKESGGAERFYVRLVRALHQAGHPVLAINPPGSAVARELGDDVPQAHVPMRAVWDLPSRWRIGRLVRRFDADIVQTYMGRATRLTHLRRSHPPVHIARLGGFYKLKGYRHAHAWIGNTQGIHRYLLEGGLPGERVFHIGNFVDLPPQPDAQKLSEIRQTLRIPRNALIIGAVGRLHPNKGFVHLLDALADLPPSLGEHPLILLLAGDGPLREDLQRHASRMGVAERVRWTGWTANPAPYYALADVFACPSIHEPLGNVVLEAWSHHRAVVATRSDGPLELITDGRDGLLVEPGDHRGLASALRRLLEAGTEARSALGETGYETLLAHHSQDAIVSAYLQCYAKLLESLHP